MKVRYFVSFSSVVVLTMCLYSVIYVFVRESLSWPIMESSKPGLMFLSTGSSLVDKIFYPAMYAEMKVNNYDQKEVYVVRDRSMFEMLLKSGGENHN